MIKHIVMFKLRAKAEGETKEANAEELKRRLEKLEDHIRVLLSIEVGLNISSQSSAYDLVLNTEFRSLADLEAYRVHPEHQKVVRYIEKVCETRAVVDFIV